MSDADPLDRYELANSRRPEVTLLRLVKIFPDTVITLHDGNSRVSQIKDRSTSTHPVDGSAKIESLGDELKRDGIEVTEQAVLPSWLEPLIIFSQLKRQSCSRSDWTGIACLPPCHEL